MAKASRSAKASSTSSSASNKVAPPSSSLSAKMTSSSRSNLVTPDGSPIVRNTQRKDTDIPKLQITSSTDSAEVAGARRTPATTKKKKKKKSAPAAVITPMTEGPKRKKRAVVVTLSATSAAFKPTPIKPPAASKPRAAAGKSPAKKVVPHKRSSPPKKHRRRAAVLSAVAAAGATVLYSKISVDWRRSVSRTQSMQQQVVRGKAENKAETAPPPAATAVVSTVRKAQDAVMQTMNQTASWSRENLFVLRPKEDAGGSSADAVLSRPPAKALRGIVSVEKEVAVSSSETKEAKKLKLPDLRAFNEKVHQKAQGLGQFMKNIVDEDSDILFL